MTRALATVLFILFLILSVIPAYARKASLTEITVTNTRDHLLVYFSVTDCFTDDMVEAINNGINTTFTFLIKLDEVSELWWNKEIADLRVSHNVRYDSLKKTYLVRMSEKGDETIALKDFEEVKKLMSEIVGLKIIPVQELKKGTRYQLRVKAELDKIRLPFYLHYVFFFLSLWDFETDWYTVDFKY